MKRILSILAVGVMLLGACSSDDSDDTTATTEAEPDVEEALSTFCEDGDSYVEALDTYGQIFTEEEPTVGDLKEGADPLMDAREQAQDSGDDLKAAIEQQEEEVAEAEEDAMKEAEEAKEAGEEPPSTTSTSLVEVDVSEDTLAGVENAEGDFTATTEGIDDSTPLSEASVSLTSAAYALEVTWLALLTEAGCVDDEGESLAQVREYVAAVQSDLETAGYYKGKIDGIWGTETATAVKELQTANGLPETGYLDPPSQAALADELAGQESNQVSALQGVLKSLGYYDGPIDGQWSQQLEDGLKEFQRELGVPETGQVDEATLRGFQDRLAEVDQAMIDSTSTTLAPETTAPTTAAAPE